MTFSGKHASGSGSTVRWTAGAILVPGGRRHRKRGNALNHPFSKDLITKHYLVSYSKAYLLWTLDRCEACTGSNKILRHTRKRYGERGGLRCVCKPCAKFAAIACQADRMWHAKPRITRTSADDHHRSLHAYMYAVQRHAFLVHTCRRYRWHAISSRVEAMICKANPEYVYGV
jgi:hypothetical protein